MTRDDLLRIIAGALRRSRTFLDEKEARAAADTILRDLKAAGVTIRRQTPAEPAGSDPASEDRG